MTLEVLFRPAETKLYTNIKGIVVDETTITVLRDIKEQQAVHRIPKKDVLQFTIEEDL